MIQLTASIDCLSGVYKACISLSSVTPASGIILRATGGLLIELGGVITGAAARPDETPTVVEFIPTNGETPTIVAQAAAVVSSDTGEILTLTVTNPGRGYTGVPDVRITGQGVGATATATLVGDSVDTVSIATAGSGYKNVPTPVTIALPSRLAKVTQDLPFYYEVALADDPLADVKARVWCDAILSRIQAEYTEHVAVATRFVETRTVQIL